MQGVRWQPVQWQDGNGQHEIGQNEPRKDRTYKGSLSVFLSLVILLLLSLVLALLHSASLQTAKNQSRLTADTAAFSAFGEYSKNLLETYDVFALDTAYETSTYGYDALLSRMEYYGSAGIQQEITGVQTLTDNQGQAFREQVLAYMQSRNQDLSWEGLMECTENWDEEEVEGDSLAQEKNSLKEQALGIASEALQGLCTALTGNVLELAAPGDFIISDKSIEGDTQVSNRERNTGFGNFSGRTDMGNVTNRIQFARYLQEKFGCARSENSSEGSLSYEQEYILCGKESDRENLESVTGRLAAIRFVENYIYLQGDSAKKAEAEAAALAISTALLLPEIAETVNQILLVYWAYGESVIDVRALLAGNRIGLVKDQESWQLSLGNLFLLGTSGDTVEGQDVEGGITYEQCLEVLFVLKNQGRLAMRALDRIEENLQTQMGGNSFRADWCITNIAIENTANIDGRYTYTFPLEYGYF